MSPGEWGALPWWLQRLYCEGLETEFYDPEGRGEATSDGAPVTMNHQPGEFAAMGLREQTLV